MSYLVIGTGRSGIAAAGLLASEGKEVILYDDKEDIDKNAISEKLDSSDNITIYGGSIPDEPAAAVEEVVVSPGVPLDCDTVMYWKNRGVKIIGEVELAYEHEKGVVAAITGTNGKTTTTSLVGGIMKKKYS